MPGGGPVDDAEGLVELAGHGRERPAGQRPRNQVQLEVEPVDLQYHPGVGRLGPDLLVAGQGPALAVDQAQLQLRADGHRPGAEGRPLQQPPQRLEALLQALLEPLVVGGVEVLALDRQAHGSTLAAAGRPRTVRTARFRGAARPYGAGPAAATVQGPTGTKEAPMKVSDLQPHELFTAQAEETLEEAADRMSWHQVGALPVFEGQHLVGIITERDLTAALAEGADPGVTPVSDYMTPAPEVLRPDSDLAEAARQMLQLGVRHLPVVQRGRLVGVLSMRDVLGAGGAGAVEEDEV